MVGRWKSRRICLPDQDALSRASPLQRSPPSKAPTREHETCVSFARGDSDRYAWLTASSSPAHPGRSAVAKPVGSAAGHIFVRDPRCARRDRRRRHPPRHRRTRDPCAPRPSVGSTRRGRQDAERSRWGHSRRRCRRFVLLLVWHECRPLAWTLLAATAARPLLEWTLKELVDRPRPNIDRLVAGNGPSFPSGHVMAAIAIWGLLPRSEEHTSELQSLMRISYAVFCLKKKHKKRHN